MTYTFKEIAKAWAEFTKPVYLVKAGDKTRFESLKNGSMTKVPESSSVDRLKIDYSQWLTFLAGESWKDQNLSCCNTPLDDTKRCSECGENC